MYAQEFWLYVSFLLVAISTALPLTITATYIPLKKIPGVLKTIASVFYQKLYFLLVVSLFIASIGTGIYVTLVFDLIRAGVPKEILRTGLFFLFIINTFLVLLAFKKQTLSKIKIFLSSIICVSILVIATQENTMDYFTYVYILPILALFAIVRYGIHKFVALY